MREQSKFIKHISAKIKNIYAPQFLKTKLGIIIYMENFDLISAIWDIYYHGGKSLLSEKPLEKLKQSVTATSQFLWHKIFKIRLRLED